MQPARQDLPVTPGATYRDTVRIMQPEFVYRSITGIDGSPLRLTVPDHGLASDWPIWVRGAQGMPDLNRDPLSQRPHWGKRIGADLIEVNSLSAAGLRPQGGQLIYRLPVDLSEATAQMRLYREDELLFELGAGAGASITALGTVVREMTPAQTAQLKGCGVRYTFDVIYPAGVIVRYFEGRIT